MTEQEIRAEILRTLAGLYEDWLTRSQFQRFTFTGTDQKTARDILKDLARHLLIEQREPDVARMTQLGHQLLGAELARLGEEATGVTTAGAQEDLPQPGPAEVEELSREVGGADYVSTAIIIAGRFVTNWASEGFQRVSGYSAEELERAGGWPTILRDIDSPAVGGLLEHLLAGESVAGELTIVAKGGRLRRVRFVSRPRWNASGTRVVGIIGAGRDITDVAHSESPPASGG